MVKKLLILGLALVLFGPASLLLAIGVLMTPAANAACTVPGGTVTVGNIPDSLSVTARDGTTFTLNKQQLTHAATIITIGNGIEGVGRPGIQVALMAALTESTLRQLSNTGTYPESANYPNDGNGGDHDSLGLFQMRPQSGWGTVAELMDPQYQASAFFGGPTGPNYPSPRGLLDIPGWQDMDPGEAAQSVEVSVYPDRYQNYQPVAESILDALTGGTAGMGGPSTAAHVASTGSSRVVFPLPEGTWVMTSPFGPRVHPITGEPSFHTGTDFAAPDGTPILAAADGTVTFAGASGGYGNLIVIEHQIDGATIATAYGHMWDTGIHVHIGDRVQAGQHIGDAGSSGMSTGAHLHFEVRPGGTNAEAVDPAKWLNDHDAADLPEATTDSPEECQNPDDPFDPDTGITPPARNADGSWPPGTCTEPDPTQPGRQGACVTPRTARMVEQIEAMNVGHNGITCWDPHEQNPTSDHPKGKACDIVFGTLGQFPKGTDKENGDQLANWLVANAETWAVKYIIWQGRIWTTARAGEGWRPYTGGGIYDPSDPTGGHYDHIHLSMA